MKRRRAAVITLFLLAALIGATGLWLRAERRQHTLNRQLIGALVKGDNKQAIALVEAGADPNTRYAPSPVPSLLEQVKQLFHRSSSPANMSPTALSIACGATWDHFAIRSRGLSFTAQQQRPDAPQLVQTMLQHDANVKVRGSDGSTPLLWAAAFNRHNTVGVLLEHGADANVKDNYGWTPLISGATFPYDSKTVRLLLEHGADVNTQDNNGQTVLMWELVLSQPPYRNAPSTNDTALKDMFRHLLVHGANPNLADKNGNTPLKLAQECHCNDIVALLRQYGARK